MKCQIQTGFQVYSPEFLREWDLFCLLKFRWSLLLLLNSSLAAPHSKANNWEASVSTKERSFIQKSQHSGEKVDSCPETNFKDSAQPWQFLKGKRGKNLSEYSRQEVGFCIILHCVQTGWLFLQKLPCLHDLPAGFLRGLLWVES